MIFPSGALPDTRPAAEREKDYKAEEVASGVAVPIFQNPKPTALLTTIFDQWYVGSCVPHGFYKQLEFEGIIAPPDTLSQLQVYRKRSNYPNPGSGAVDLYTQIKDGQDLNKNLPTQPGMTEAMATSLPRYTGYKLLSDFKYFEFTDRSAVPQAVAGGKAVAIFIFATEEEWSQEYVTVKNPGLTASDAYVRHCVCIIPKGDFTENGTEWMAVHDSAKFGGRHLRYISRDFFLKRCYYASQVFKDGSLPTPPLPPTNALPFTPCQQGNKTQAVKDLQAYLVKGGFLEAQYVTGNYGAITAKALLWFQLRHHEKFDVEIPQLLDWSGKYFGDRTIKVVKLLANE